MLIAILVCHLFAAFFIILEMGAHRVSGMLMFLYFYLFSLGMYAFAFSTSNMVLSIRSPDVESHGFFELFALLGGIAALLLFIMTGIFTVFIRRRLSLVSVSIGGFLLYSISILTLFILSKIPQLNWF